MVSKKNLLNYLDEEDIKQAIMNAELDTSSEIRVHIEDICIGDPVSRANEVFEDLGINNTLLRNGVLFYVALYSRKFAVITDEGINKVTNVYFWKHINQFLINYFREGQFTEGLVEGITQTGIYLKQFFPFLKDDENELPDEISYKKKG